MTTGKAKVIGSFEPLEDDDLIRANELKRRDDRHSIKEAILRLQAETGKHFALDKAVYAGAIKSYAPGDDKDPIVCEPHQRDLREEIYWDDVIKWIAIEFPRFKYPVTPIPAAPVVTAGAPGGVEHAKHAPVENAKESKERREDRRLNACEAYGLVMPKKSEGRLPDGIAKVAKLEGIKRQPFSKDVKAAIERRNSLKREG
jgi:hypothetical protein